VRLLVARSPRAEQTLPQLIISDDLTPHFVIAWFGHWPPGAM
jgi:hypothetical protein